MTKYACSECGMEVQNIICGKCGAELEYNQISKDDGGTVNVSECPNGCGMIKSPICHGSDMVPDA